ncbi:MAG: zinc dependent phospholipase C family protein [Desulfovibrio sp.]
MPKEYIHFRVAERAVDLLASTRIGRELAPDRGRLRAALLLGAVFHDALYYLETPGRREPDSLLELPHLLHGKEGHDTHGLLRAQAAHAAALRGSPDGPAARAFLVGLAAHLSADVVLHPLVYHLSGDYFHEPEAVERHRLLESCLDLAVAGDRAELRRRRLNTLLRQCDPVRLAPLDFLAALAGRDSRTTARGMRRAWTVFGRMQALALSLPGAVLARLRPLLPRKARQPREIAALFYPSTSSVNSVLAFLGGSIAYRHPVTNEAHTATIRALMEQAALKTVRLCARLEPAVFGDADPAEVLGRGPGLDTGLDTNSEAPRQLQRSGPLLRHFARPRFPEI